MPIHFEPGWNGLNLAKLKKRDVPAAAHPAESVRDIALFWKAKARMKRLGPAKVADLDTEIADAEKLQTAKKSDPSVRFTGQMAKKLEADRAERETISKALVREKVTSAMVKKFAPEIANKFTGVTSPKLLDPVMEQIHNDRLRIPDAGMLKSYDRLAIRVAMVDAKPRFTHDSRVAALFDRAIAKDGNPVMVTQGVHQSDDPHFDVLMPGEAQQYHIEVTLGAPLKVRSVSYMLSAQDSGGKKKARTVMPDPAAAAAAGAPHGPVAVDTF